jgi:hypothetical protein
MHTKLAGHLPLQDMIANVISGARQKLAAAEEKDEKKPNPFAAKSEKKDEKKPEAEKKASAGVIDHSDPEQIEKLASALEQAGEYFEKEAADSVNNGGESKQGGEQLATGGAVGGKQSYKKDGSKKHSVPVSTGLQKAEVGAATQVPNDHAKAPGAGQKQGQMKTASETVMEKIQAAAKANLEKQAKGLPPALAANAQKVEKAQDPSKPGAEKPDLGEKGKKDDKEEKDEEKKASAEPVDFILGKLAESPQGGMTLDSKSGEGPKPPSNPGREMISSNAAVVAATKAKAKAPQKKLLSQVLSEPAQSKSTDSKVHENLRNATKGGVKIAAAKVLLQKIAEQGCQCDGKGECKYCKMKAAMKKQSNAAGAMSGMPTAPKPPTPATM